MNNVTSYNFLKDKEYTIYISLKNYFNVIINYCFFPIEQNTIINVSQEGYYIIDSPI